MNQSECFFRKTYLFMLLALACLVVSGCNSAIESTKLGGAANAVRFLGSYD